jgi:hypothetical protein
VTANDDELPTREESHGEQEAPPFSTDDPTRVDEDLTPVPIARTPSFGATACADLAVAIATFACRLQELGDVFDTLPGPQRDYRLWFLARELSGLQKCIVDTRRLVLDIRNGKVGP